MEKEINTLCFFVGLNIVLLWMVITSLLCLATNVYLLLVSVDSLLTFSVNFIFWVI